MKKEYDFSEGVRGKVIQKVEYIKFLTGLNGKEEIELSKIEHKGNRECGGCNCAPGEYHIHKCTMELCPNCGLYLKGCGCHIKEII